MKSKRTVKKRSSARSKFVGNFSFRKLDRKWQILIFVCVFGLVGSIMLWSLQARSPYVGGSDEIIFQHIKQQGGIKVDRKNPEGTEQNVLMQLTGDGTLLCHDGTETTLKRGRLNSEKMAILLEDIGRQSPGDIPGSVPESRPDKLRSKWELLLIGYRDGAHIVSSHNSAGEETIGFRTVTNRLSKICDQATDKVDKKELNKARSPKFNTISASSAWNRYFGNLFNSKVSASHKSTHGGGNSDGGGGGKGIGKGGNKNTDTTEVESAQISGAYSQGREDEMNSRINNHRQSGHGKPALGVSSCLRNAMRAHAKKMAEAGDIFHSSEMGGQPLSTTVNQYCNGGNDSGWQAIGENVGRGSTTLAIFDAYENSPSHHANHYGNYSYFATGNFVLSTGYEYTASLYVNCGSNNTCHSTVGGQTYTPPTTVSYDNATCVSVFAPSSVAAGQAFSASFTVKNTGNVTWNLGGASGYWRLASSNPRNNSVWGVSRVDKTGSVGPNSSVTFSASFRAPSPSSTKTYSFNWEMVKESAYWLADQPDYPGGDYPNICARNISVTVSTTSGGTTSTVRTRLNLGEKILNNQKIHSPSQNHYTHMQTDGNLVTRTSSGSVVWHSGTYGAGSGTYAVFQSDGNFVIYKGTGGYCHTATYGKNAAVMKMQDDGNFVIYSSSGSAVWSTLFGPNNMYCT